MSQAMWDVVIEYYLLQSPLCEEDLQSQRKISITTNRLVDASIKPITTSSSKEVVCKVFLDTTKDQILSNTKYKPDRFIKNVEVPKAYLSRRKRHIPLNSTAQRSILFQDIKHANLNKSDDKKCQIKLTPFELGDEGIMTKTCSVTLHNWLEFAVELGVPAIKTYSISLTNRHSLSVIIQALQHLVMQLSSDSTKVFMCLPIEDLENETYKEVFVPYSSLHFTSKAILVSRNFEQWKAYTSPSNADLTDIINPPYVKNMPRFSPAISADNTFIPRQKLLWAMIKSDIVSIVFYLHEICYILLVKFQK